MMFKTGKAKNENIRVPKFTTDRSHVRTVCSVSYVTKLPSNKNFVKLPRPPWSLCANYTLMLRNNWNLTRIWRSFHRLHHSRHT